MKKTLKWSLVMMLAVFGLTFASCSDDDDKDSPKDFNGIYSTTSTERVLDLRYRMLYL